MKNKNVKKQFKGLYGKKLERWILKNRYGIDYNPTTNSYDLPLNLNKLTGRNVSIKTTKTNIVYCSDIFNFLNSKCLELIIVQYSLCTINQVIIKCVYLFENLDIFFIHLRLNLDLVKLNQLNNYVKGLKYAFSKEERANAHKLARLVIKNDFCKFKVNCKLSSTNKRIQCTLKLNELIKWFKPKRLIINTKIVL